MKRISITDNLGLTQGKEYEALEASAGYYKVRLDNGNIAYRCSSLFKTDTNTQNKERVTE